MKFGNIIVSGLHLLYELIFPTLCIFCDKLEPVKNEYYCLPCQQDLPLLTQTEDVYAALIGALVFPDQVEEVYTLFYFTQPGKIQNLIHKIKYKSRPDLAFRLGTELGKRMKPNAQTAYMLIPVPLHPLREKERGYNQSDYIARGISSILNWEINRSLLNRIEYKQSQTRLSSENRLTSLEYSFEVNANNQEMMSSPVMLVDDVITTGATIRACYNELNKHRFQKIAVSCLAVSI